MAKEINIARLAVDMIANTGTYRSQLADLIKQTDKRLKELEKINAGSNKKIGADDAQATKSAAREAKKKADIEIENERRAASQKAAIRRKSEQEAQKSARRTSNTFTQAGFQIQDSIVQYQGNIAATTIIAQQGSQFLGTFGAAGALAGAALAAAAVGVGIFQKSMGKVKIESLSVSASLTKLDKHWKQLSEVEQRYTKTNLASSMAEERKKLDELTKSFYKQTNAIAVSRMSRQNLINSTKDEQEELKNISAQLSESRTKYNELSVAMNTLGVDKNVAAFETLAVSLAEEIELTGKSAKQIAIYNAVKNDFNEAQILAVGLFHDELAAAIAADEAVKAKTATDKAAAKASVAAAKAKIKVAEALALRNATSITQTIEKLKIQNDEYGKSKSTLAVYKAGLKGATDGQKLEIERLTKLIEKKKEDAKATAVQISTLAKAKTDAATQAAKLAGLDTGVGGSGSEVQKLNEESTLLQNNFDAKLISEEAYLSARNGLKTQYDKLASAATIEEADLLAKQLSDVQDIASKANIDLKATEVEAIAGLGITLNEDSSALMKGLFLAQQVAAITAGVMNTEEAATAALAIDPTGTLSLNARIQGYASVAVIAAQTAGQFHGGTDALPSSMDNKSFMLKAGERVVQPEANKKLTSFLDSPVSMDSGNKITQNINGSAMMSQRDFESMLARSSIALAGLNNRETKKRASTKKRL